MRKKMGVLFLMVGVGLSPVFTAAQAGKKMNKETQFDFREHGRVEKYELNLQLKVTQKGSDVLVALDFENISKRDLNVYPMLWFMHLEITVDGKKLDYIGPSASMPPPQKSNYKTIKPGDQWSTESILVNSYYRVPKIPGAVATVKYSFHPNVKAAEASFVIK